jgi:hypothetical protein
MPSRKQRRRREKERRHEWEEVWVDAEGNELDAPPDEAQPSRGEKRSSAPVRRQTGTRVVQPPSWRRVGKRGLIFAPLMFLTVSFLSSELSTVEKLFQTFFLLAFFLPFSYAMDALMYRMYVRRAGGTATRKS